jgi:hypothetical protein
METASSLLWLKALGDSPDVVVSKTIASIFAIDWRNRCTIAS